MAYSYLFPFCYLEHSDSLTLGHALEWRAGLDYNAFVAVSVGNIAPKKWQSVFSFIGIDDQEWSSMEVHALLKPELLLQTKWIFPQKKKILLTCYVTQSDVHTVPVHIGSPTSRIINNIFYPDILINISF